MSSFRFMLLTTSVRWAGYAERLGEKIIAHITTDGISEDNKPLGNLNIQGGMVLNGYSRNRALYLGLELFN
jgi:hypothetical protein